MNIGSLLSRNARYRPDRVAVVCGELRLTHLQLNRDVNRLANALLALGVNKGDSVACLLPDCMELVEVFWATAKIGAVVVPVGTWLSSRDLVSQLKGTDAVMLVTDSMRADAVEAIKMELPAIAHDRYILTDGNRPGFRWYQGLKAGAGDDEPEGAPAGGDAPYTITFSNGASGQPKAVVHTHRGRGAYAASLAAAFRLTSECISVHVAPLALNWGLVSLMPTAFAGGGCIVLPQFDPGRFMLTVAREKATHAFMSAPQVAALVDCPDFAPDRLGSLQMLLSTGSMLRQEHRGRLSRVLPNRVCELYGVAEGFVTVLAPEDYCRKPASVGVPPPFFEMRIVDPGGRELPAGEVGQICGRGPALMQSYYRRPELTRQAVRDGWLHTGDLGYVDDDGFLYLIDRVQDIIHTRGVVVYPRDIEEVVARHPAARETAVFGVPHDTWGETPVAAVVLNEPGSQTAEALKKWINSHVAARFQRIAEVMIVEDFPRNMAGMVNKRELREQYTQRRGAPLLKPVTSMEVRT